MEDSDTFHFLDFDTETRTARTRSFRSPAPSANMSQRQMEETGHSKVYPGECQRFRKFKINRPVEL